MKRIVLVVAILFLLPYAVNGQEQQPVQASTSAPASDARYEIVQTAVAPKVTLKLDRITGNVERLITGKSGNLRWEKMRVLPHPKAVNLAKPHYRIFVSSQADQPTLLLDTETGATWQLVTASNSVWQPIE